MIAPALDLSGVTFARAGQMAYATVDQRSTIEDLTLDPVREQIVGTPEVVLRESSRISYVNWSPDAQWLAFSTIGTRENLFLVRPDGTGYRQVTDDEFRNPRPPVARRIAHRLLFEPQRPVSDLVRERRWQRLPSDLQRGRGPFGANLVALA